ncbi:MAG TPA: hypothetical protein DEG06_08365 [Lachnospiraceae bacterium]|nr:hypothetical protein [Lachnospiraceae bacterium]HBY72240.1 hypothetical protein [Lachnospiraceae bacterium]HCA69780.1 hypothetical protein [Lachnospiraceae bacterium]HCM12162.1 hypothetical protein [Lachnospiraceae bacterium]HCR39314.1 hypothetical protein [Lachnospiraceae bacterium]
MSQLLKSNFCSLHTIFSDLLAEGLRSMPIFMIQHKNVSKTYLFKEHIPYITIKIRQRKTMQSP